MIWIKTKILNGKRCVVLLLAIFGVFVGYIARLADWQIINHEYYFMRANSSHIYFVKTDPVRGEILDCDGNGLAINDAGYKLVLDRLLVEKDQENELIIEIAELLEKLGDSWTDILPINFSNNQFCFDDTAQSEKKNLLRLLKLSSDATAQDCMNAMIKKYKVQDLAPSKQRVVCSVKYNIDKNGIYNLRNTPYVFADNISKNTVMVLSEKYEHLKGVRVQTSLVRKYINGDIAPHIVGYTGLMSSEEYEKKKDVYTLDTAIGKSGVEAFFEDFLHGKGGKRMIQMSHDGNIVNVVDKEPALAGNSVYLTISSKLQQAANKSLAENIARARRAGAHDCFAGAAVALNVKDFSVLAAATYPSYDLTRFVEDKAYYSQLYKDSSVPLLNRAFSGAYAPGSVYKPLVACAALQSGKLTPEETVCCNGGFNYYTGYRLRCMGHHGHIKLVNALAKSCNVFFAEMGRRLGATELANWANKFGIGKKTGIEIGESSGVVAGPEHSAAVKSKWYESGSSQAAIGQSDNMFTPIQLATYVATIANGGTRYKTHIIKKITDYARTKIIKNYEPEIIEKVDISPENLELVKQGMREVAKSGTARDFANYPVAIGAKTGTAQNSGSDHVLFICFAPYENPEIAIVVVLDHGQKGMFSKAVAREMLNCYFNISK